MPLLSRFFRIIGLLVLAAGLQGCGGLLKVAYNQAPEAIYWWLDGFFDLREVQSLRLRPDLEALHAWHRKHELPAYADLLHKVATLVPENLTQQQSCEVFSIGRAHAIAATNWLEPTITAIAPTFNLEQVAHLETQLEKRNKKWRADWIEASATKRTAKRVKEAVSRAEMFYGTLEARQLAVVRDAIARSSYDPQVSYRETVRRQQDGLTTLRMLVNTKPPAPKVKFEMRALFERSLNSPDPAYRSYQDTITREGCAAVADLHNATTPAQRSKAVKVLHEYEKDFRELAAR